MGSGVPAGRLWGDSPSGAAASEKYDEAYVGRRQKATMNKALFC